MAKDVNSLLYDCLSFYVLLLQKDLISHDISYFENQAGVVRTLKRGETSPDQISAPPIHFSFPLNHPPPRNHRPLFTFWHSSSLFQIKYSRKLNKWALRLINFGNINHLPVYQEPPPIFILKKSHTPSVIGTPPPILTSLLGFFSVRKKCRPE